MKKLLGISLLLSGCESAHLSFEPSQRRVPARLFGKQTLPHLESAVQPMVILRLEFAVGRMLDHSQDGRRFQAVPIYRSGNLEGFWISEEWAAPFGASAIAKWTEKAAHKSIMLNLLPHAPQFLDGVSLLRRQAQRIIDFEGKGI